MRNFSNVPQRLDIRYQLASIAWLTFLMAIAAAGIFFSLFDPHALALASGHDWPAWDALGAYTIGFFCFWGSFTAAGLVALQCTRAVPVGRSQRPG